MADEEVSGPGGDAEPPSETPRPEPLRTFFQLTATRRDGDRILYYGESLVPDRALMRRIAPAFREIGYEVELTRTSDADVVIARPIGAGSEGIPWTNLVLFVTTVLSTLFVGAYGWYYVPLSEITANPLVILQAWPFTAAVLGVLLVHELGHYAAARYYGVNVSLPYVIPFVFPFGTLGAVIRMKGQMPSRKVLFDIGAAGPLAGLAATIVVTAIGLSLDPITIPERILEADGSMIRFNDPPLLTLIASALGEPTAYEAANKAAHPVVIGGWVGMFFTLLNLLPVGQLDGGHIMRAMIGERQETVASFVPAVLFGIAAYLYYVLEYGLNESVGLWAFWGVFALFIAFNGPADPLDESQLGWPRMLVGIITFALGLLCFMLVPVQVVSG